MRDRLYYEDPYLQEFTATVVERGQESDGTPYIVLDQTAFYPTGGGQPCDTGVIEDVDVIDVEEVDGCIHHRLRTALPVDVTRVTGRIDWTRRFDHMQQHTGQHLLTAAFEELFQAETVGFHLGKDRVTIDLAIAELRDDMVQQAVALANRIAYENRPITTAFLEPEQLATLPLRKPPSVTGNIRIVTIADFDYNPCGGTHPRSTGEAGPLQVLDWERSKGNVRVSFICGLRVVNELRVKHDIVQQLSRMTSTPESELPHTVSRLQDERKELEKALQDAQSILIEADAAKWIEQAEEYGAYRLLLIPLAERTMADLQKLAQFIVTRMPNGIVLLVSSGGRAQFVFARGVEVTVAMNDLLKEALVLVDGKGGGQPAMAQGGGASDRSAAELLVDIRPLLVSKI